MDRDVVAAGLHRPDVRTLSPSSQEKNTSLALIPCGGVSWVGGRCSVANCCVCRRAAAGWATAAPDVAPEAMPAIRDQLLERHHRIDIVGLYAERGIMSLSGGLTVLAAQSRYDGSWPRQHRDRRRVRWSKAAAPRAHSAAGRRSVWRVPARPSGVAPYRP